MTITERYEQAKKDYFFLCNHHNNPPYDITGGFVADEKFFQLLKNPCKKEAAQIYENLILYSAGVGFATDRLCNYIDLDDERVCDIYRRHYCEDEIFTAFGVRL